MLRSVVTWRREIVRQTGAPEGRHDAVPRAEVSVRASHGLDRNVSHGPVVPANRKVEAVLRRGVGALSEMYCHEERHACRQLGHLHHCGSDAVGCHVPMATRNVVQRERAIDRRRAAQEVGEVLGDVSVTGLPAVAGLRSVGPHTVASL